MIQFKVNNTIKQFIIIALLNLLYSANTMAAIHCWTNDEGQRECSYTVPKKYLGREIQIINNRGQVIRTIPADKTPEQKRKEAELAKIEAEKKRIQKEQRRKDRILLNTYVAVDDIILSRDTKSNAIDSIIIITKSNRDKQQKILDTHTKRAGNFERKNAKVPEKIIKNIKNAKAKLKEFDDFIEKKKQEKLALHLKYDADLTRFKELKALRPR